MALEQIASIQAATLHDALSKASKIAPTKGSAFDRAAGFHLTFTDSGIEIRATDEEMTYWQFIEADTINETGIRTVYRLPSVMLAAFVASLPMNSDQHLVRFLHDPAKPREIHIKFGKTKLGLKMNLITGGSYPEWQPIDFVGMTEAQELASRIESVVWACDESGHFAGSHIDGKFLTSINGRSMAAMTVCEIDVDAPVTALLKPLVPLLKLGTEIRIKVVESRIYVALDDKTQITSTVINKPWPNMVDALQKRPLPNSFSVKRQRVIDAINRLMIVADRTPVCHITVKDGQLDFLLKSDSGEMSDACVTNDSEHTEDHLYKYNPAWVIKIFESFSCAMVKVRYNPETPTKHPFHLSDPASGYEAWLMPLSDAV
jgi:DNA polymerase III sliding clamp (beta) subunit (PCNA family)